MQTDVKTSTLANGVRVITSSLPHVESVAMGLWAGTGGRHEPKKLSGVSHFIEHMLFKGTRKRSAKKISQEIEGGGGYLNAFTQEESTCYYARVAYDQLSKTMDVLTDMLRFSKFDKGELDRERGVILEEIMMYRDQPQDLVQEMLGESMWKNHPLGRPLIGTPATLKAMSRKSLVDYKRKKYVPDNTVVALAGKVDHDRCVSEVRRLLGGLRGGTPPSFKPITAQVGQGGASFGSKEIEQGHLALGVRLFGRHDRRRYALRILNAALGENMSSRLFQVVREKHGLAYSIHSHIHLFDDSGALVVSAGLDRKRIRKAVALTIREMAKLKAKPLGAAELRRAKDYAIGRIRLGWESTTHQMIWLGENILARNQFVQPEKVIEGLGKVTAAEIQKLACSLFRKSKLSLSLVHPDLSDSDKSAIWETAKKL